MYKVAILETYVMFDPAITNAESVAKVATNLLREAAGGANELDHQLAYEYEKIGKPKFGNLTVSDTYTTNEPR
jgi:hypothetical protein